MSYILLIGIVFLGFFLVSKIDRSHYFFKFLLTFSGGFLLSQIFFEILPELYKLGNFRVSGLWIMFGILLQVFLEFFSKGLEHGHIHISKKKYFPFLLFLSLIIHAFFEGVPLFHEKVLILGILIHKLPVAIMLSTLIKEFQISKFLTFLILISFAISTPLGVFFGQFISESSIYLSILAISVGVIFHISTIILFESNEHHRFSAKKILTIILSIIFAYSVG